MNIIIDIFNNLSASVKSINTAYLTPSMLCTVVVCTVHVRFWEGAESIWMGHRANTTWTSSRRNSYMGLCGLSGAAVLAGCTRLSLPGETLWALPPQGEQDLQAARFGPHRLEGWRSAWGSAPFALFPLPEQSREGQWLEGEINYQNEQVDHCE